MFKKDIYKQIADADNVYLCHGRGRAFAKNLYNKLTLPDSSGEDAYSYLFAKSKGYKFSFAENAKVWYKVSTEIKDREIQSKRFLKGKENLKKLFPKDFVRENFHIPKLAVLKTAIIYFFKHPILITSYFLWIIYILAFSKLKIKDTGKWQMSPSSKILT